MKDTILMMPDHEVKAQAIMKTHEEWGNRILIAGYPGTAKTEVSMILERKLWEEKQILAKTYHLDEYYKVPWQTRNEVRSKDLSCIGPKEIDWNKLFFDTYYHKKEYDIVIVEGLYAFHESEHEDYAIFMDGTQEETMLFRKVRGKEKLTEFRQKVLDIEYEEVVKDKYKADLIIRWNT